MRHGLSDFADGADAALVAEPQEYIQDDFVRPGGAGRLLGAFLGQEVPRRWTPEGNREIGRPQMERGTGLEPATSTLGKLRSAD